MKLIMKVIFSFSLVILVSCNLSRTPQQEFKELSIDSANLEKEMVSLEKEQQEYHKKMYSALPEKYKSLATTVLMKRKEDLYISSSEFEQTDIFVKIGIKMMVFFQDPQLLEEVESYLEDDMEALEDMKKDYGQLNTEKKEIDMRRYQLVIDNDNILKTEERQDFIQGIEKEYDIGIGIEDIIAPFFNGNQGNSEDRMIQCPVCQGVGEIYDYFPDRKDVLICHQCNGNRYVRVSDLPDSWRYK